MEVLFNIKPEFWELSAGSGCKVVIVRGRMVQAGHLVLPYGRSRL